MLFLQHKYNCGSLFSRALMHFLSPTARLTQFVYVTFTHSFRYSLTTFIEYE